MNLPTNYEWLADVKGMPKTIQIGLSLLGTAEIVGKGSSKTIMSWRDELNQNGVKIAGFSDDDIAWCGLFVAFVAWSRMRNPDEVVKDPLWARNWAKYGNPSPSPCLGDVLVFSRGSGGHVGFYVAEDATCFHVLGGNQSNRVSIARIPRHRLIAARRPPYNTTPRGVKRYFTKATGAISSNEA